MSCRSKFSVELLDKLLVFFITLGQFFIHVEELIVLLLDLTDVAQLALDDDSETFIFLQPFTLCATQLLQFLVEAQLLGKFLIQILLHKLHPVLEKLQSYPHFQLLIVSSC
jgi:hypothetical protein